MENSMYFLKELKTEVPCDLAGSSTSGHISKGNEIFISEKYLHSHVHGSITHNGQGMETTYISYMDEWITTIAYATD